MTVTFKGFAEVEERFVTESVLDPPTEIEEGLKLHVAPPLQDRAIGATNVLGPAAEIEKVAFVVPMRRTLDRVLVESEKTGFPVPAKRSVGVLTALDVMLTLPLTLPVERGVKLTVMLQLWPTFNDTGMVGRLVPQVLDCAKPAVAPILVMVTG